MCELLNQYDLGLLWQILRSFLILDGLPGLYEIKCRWLAVRRLSLYLISYKFCGSVTFAMTFIGPLLSLTLNKLCALVNNASFMLGRYTNQHKSYKPFPLLGHSPYGGWIFLDLSHGPRVVRSSYSSPLTSLLSGLRLNQSGRSWQRLPYASYAG